MVWTKRSLDSSFCLGAWGREQGTGRRGGGTRAREKGCGGAQAADGKEEEAFTSARWVSLCLTFEECSLQRKGACLMCRLDPRAII